MSVLDLYAADTLAAMPARVDVPKSEPKFSVWSMLTAAPRGIAAAGSEISASALELLQPFGATMGRLAGETPDADMGRRMADEVRTGVRENLAPDPADSSAAEHVLYGFARGATKVVLGAPAGPAGFALAGAEEATTAARDLQRQGVDDATAWKAGGVQGAGLALAALPLAGNTLAQTAGLYLAGGPGGFVAQQALTREILKQGGYDQIAEGYDPLDPVGLAVSALVPAAFTAAALRGQRRAATVSREAEDAARVMLAVERREAGNPGKPGDLQAQQAHETALARAEEQMARGERVAVDDVAPRFEIDPFATNRVALPEAAAVADQLRGMGEGAFWAVEGGRLLRSGTDTPGDGGMGGEVVGRTPWVPADEWFGRMRNDMGASGLSNQGEIKAAIEKAIEGQPLNAKERRTIDWMRGEIRDMEAKLWELDDADQAAVDAFGHGLSSRDAGDFALTARAAEVDADAVERAAIRFENDDAGFMAEMRRIADGQDRQAAGTADQPGAGPGARSAAAADPPPADARGPGPEQQPARPDAATGGAATAEARLVDDATARQADALLAEQPDMLVMLDGMDAPRRLSEVLADIKAEADEMRLDGELLQVAAQCALQNGA